MPKHCDSIRHSSRYALRPTRALTLETSQSLETSCLRLIAVSRPWIRASGTQDLPTPTAKGPTLSISSGPNGSSCSLKIQIVGHYVSNLQNSRVQVPSPHLMFMTRIRTSPWTVWQVHGFRLEVATGNAPAGTSPGRRSLLVLLSCFSMMDIELLDTNDVAPQGPDMKFYGLGTLPPKGKVPFRMRKHM